MWRRYGLSIALGVLFALSWAGQALFGWHEYAAEQAQHAQAADAGGYLTTFARATLENWQSEFLQLLSFVVLSAYLVHRGSPQSRDGQDRLQRDVTEILVRLNRLEKERS